MVPLIDQEPLLGSKAMESTFLVRTSHRVCSGHTTLDQQRKSVFASQENLNQVHPSGCLSRPLVDGAKTTSGEVMKRQEDYLLVLDQPDGVLVNSLKAFCTADTCTATDAEEASICRRRPPIHGWFYV